LQFTYCFALVACSPKLYKGITQVKEIDFLLPIKIGLLPLSNSCHKLFFSIGYPGQTRNTERRLSPRLQAAETQVPRSGGAASEGFAAMNIWHGKWRVS
jgi:hypothetical protein